MSAEAIKNDYKRALDLAGEQIVIRRYAGTGPNRPKLEEPARARVTDFEAAELVGGIQQGDRKLIVLAEDLETAQFPLPLVKGDKAVVRGKEMNIEAADDSTRRVGGVLVAYEIQARG